MGIITYLCPKVISVISSLCNFPNSVSKLEMEFYSSVIFPLPFLLKCILSNLVNKANFVHNFLSMFISFLYMFRATMCPSSGEITVALLIINLTQSYNF